MPSESVSVLSKVLGFTTCNFFSDEEVLAAEGVTDLGSYAVEEGQELLPDIFL